MTTLELLKELKTKGVSLSVVGGKLHYNAPTGALTPNLKAALHAHKAELVEIISKSQYKTDLPYSPCERKKTKLRPIPPRDLETGQPICWWCEKRASWVDKFGLCRECEEVEI